MSVAVESSNRSPLGAGQTSPREAMRPAPMQMNRIPLPIPNSNPSTDSPNKPSPQIYRQSTMTGSYSNDSRPELAQKSVQYHYEVPNLSSMLYEFTNREKDRVNQAFRTGNYHSLRDLPRHLLPGNVSQWSRSKIESNLYSQVEERSYIELQSGGGFFQKFNYQEDPFESFLEQQSKDRQLAQKKQMELHGQEPFRSHPLQDGILKHQNPFTSHLWSKNEEQRYVGFLSENDPYEANAFEVLRARWINDSKKLYGDFITSQADQALKRVNRQMLPDIVSYIKRRLLADWSDINFIIGTNPEDYIELRFSMSSIDAPSGLKAYMGTLVDQDDQMLQYQLRRVTQFWGLKSGGSKKNSTRPDRDTVEEGSYGDMAQIKEEEDYVYYMLAPPWARHREPILYLQQFQS